VEEEAISWSRRIRPVGRGLAAFERAGKDAAEKTATCRSCVRLPSCSKRRAGFDDAGWGAAEAYAFLCAHIHQRDLVGARRPRSCAADRADYAYARRLPRK
jgi:hypothetical protein